MLIYQQPGEPLEHLPFLEAVLHITSAVGSIVRLDDSAANHLIGLQVVGIHNLGILETKGVDLGIPKRSS